MNTIPQAAQERAAIIDEVETFARLASSVRESILLGDYAQGLGNLEALSTLRIQLALKCANKVREEHARK